MSDSLPAGWESADLVDVCDILDSRRVPVNKEEREQRRGTVPYYGATGQVGWIDDALFNEQLVLLGEDGAPFLDPLAPKAYAISGPSWVNNHAHVLRARSGVSHRFLMHQLNILDFGQYVSGTTRLKLPQGPMRRMRLRLAPTAEQDRIVVAIEEHLSRLDAAVAALEHVRAAVPRYRGAVLKAACNGVLVETEADLAGKEGRAFESAAAGIARIANGTSVQPDTNNDLPSGWGRTSLSAIGVLDRGRSKHRPRDEPRLYGGPYPFVQTSDIKRSGGFVRQHSQTYSEAGLAQSRLWPSGTLAITIAANIAETGILTYPACFPDSVVGFVQESSPITVRFVELFLRTARDNLSRFAPATAQKNINLKILRGLAIPFPPLPEQERIVAEVDRRLSLADAAERAVSAGLAKAKRLRQAILKRAFEGKLVPQDPNDEPASVLLERIKAARAPAATTAPTRRTRRGKPA